MDERVQVQTSNIKMCESEFASHDWKLSRISKQQLQPNYEIFSIFLYHESINIKLIIKRLPYLTTRMENMQCGTNPRDPIEVESNMAPNLYWYNLGTWFHLLMLGTMCSRYITVLLLISGNPKCTSELFTASVDRLLRPCP